MTSRLESSVWPLAAGCGCVFIVTIAMAGSPWWLGLPVAALVVAAWAWPVPLPAGVLFAAVAWACVTGFDVNSFGDLHLHGAADLLRAAVLVAAGVVPGLARRVRPWAARGPLPPPEPAIPAARPGGAAGQASPGGASTGNRIGLRR